MQLHQIKPNHKLKTRARVGRGGKKGTYSGRGMKGQKSRAGKKPRPGFAGGDTIAMKRLPKKRGVRAKLKIRTGEKLSRYRKKIAIINLDSISTKFKDGQMVSPKTLFEAGLISRINKRLPRVKLLGQGELTKKVKLMGILISEKTKKKISSIATLIETKKEKLIKPKKFLKDKKRQSSKEVKKIKTVIATKKAK